MVNAIVPLTKKCSRCPVVLRRNEFPKIGNKRRPWCLDCERKRQKTTRVSSPRSKFRTALKRAVAAGTSCNLTALDLVALWEQQERRCALSGVLMTWSNGLEPTTISIDRVNPKRGYVRGNVRLICFALNSLRGAGTDEQAFEIAAAFVDRWRARHESR